MISPLMRERETFSVERRAANGNYIAYACGPLKRPRYINEKIEQELIEFKVEIEEKFEKSDVNKYFRFPLQIQEVPIPKPKSKSSKLSIELRD